MQAIYAGPMTSNTSPRATLAPACDLIFLITPSTGAAKVFSIFIASSTTTVSPALTNWASATVYRTIKPGIGAVNTASPSTMGIVAGTTDGEAVGAEGFGKGGIAVEVVPVATSTRNDRPSTSIWKLLSPGGGDWASIFSSLDVTVTIKGNPFTTTLNVRLSPLLLVVI
ncbi:uncharacterized protein METZ01_LOCUS190221 [marine metagenome]|uniref:Uncharacterized protein n=1 Tax=marine metagenome TaxID=408172 RepID=A0A382DIC9_9ZZZZ